jgi:RNA polymerase sigma factor (sigma-70 family)
MVQGLGRLKDASKLGSWLAAITRRHCYRIREQRGWKRRETDQEDEQLANLPDDAARPDETLQTLEQARLLRQAVSMLDEPCRGLMTRLFYEEEPPSYNEIAQQMNWPVSAIGPKRGRCLKRLRRVLDQIGF